MTGTQGNPVNGLYPPSRARAHQPAGRRREGPGSTTGVGRPLDLPALPCRAIGVDEVIGTTQDLKAVRGRSSARLSLTKTCSVVIFRLPC